MYRPRKTRVRNPLRPVFAARRSCAPENRLQRRDYAHKWSLDRGKIRGCTIIGYAWEALTYVHRTVVARGVSCRDWHRSCLSDKYVVPLSFIPFLSLSLSLWISLCFVCFLFVFVPPRAGQFRDLSCVRSYSPTIRNFTSCFKSRDAAISRPTMPVPHFLFFHRPPRIAALYSRNDACKINLN